MITVGDKVPEMKVLNQKGEEIGLTDYLGKKVVLYFYPKDMTSGCTKESCGFRDSLAEFNKIDCVVLGVSPDSVESHIKFIEKEGLTFDLLADTEKALCEAFGVWKEKSMYGRKYMGIERSTFLINQEGVVVNEWRKVKVTGHVDAVLVAVQEI